MKIAVSGASGFIGSALVPHLRAEGHDVVRLVRRPTESDDEVSWDPAGGDVDVARLEGVDAVVHLSGAGVGDKRWTESYKREIRDSRVVSTRTLAGALAGLDRPPQVLVSASAIGYYGDTGSTVVDETAPRGHGFLAEVVEAWEAAADPARAAGVRVVHPRTGLVVARGGGAWKRMLPLFRLGLGGRLGSGDQYWSFVTLDDELAALTWLLTADVEGPVNVTAPHPATNHEVTRAMGEVLGRPTALPVPAFALRTALGEFSSEVLGSIRAVPSVLSAHDFAFRHPDVSSAMRTLA